MNNNHVFRNNIRKQLFLLLCTVIFLLFSTIPTFCATKNWFPVDVEVWDPPFNTNRQRVQKKYIPLAKAQKKWHIQVFIPHLKDAYWLGVNYGLIDEARRLGIRLTIKQAGGYDHLDIQKEQLASILAKKEDKPDGIVIGSISAKGLNDIIKKISDNKIPIIDLINGIDSPHISARTAVSFWDMGFQTGQYLLNHQKKTGEPLSIGWFPGPNGAGWVAAGDGGFKAAIKNSPIRILTSKNGDTGSVAQSKLLKKALNDYSDKIQLIAGTAVTAEAAVNIIRKMGLKNKVKVLSYYYGPGVHRGIRRGDILAAPSDHPVLQARIAVDTIIRIIEKKKYFKHVAPKVTVIDRKNIRQWDSTTTLAPRGFKPVFSINE